MDARVETPEMAAPMRPREGMLAAVACFVGLPVAMLALAGPRLFDRPFWLDECFTWLVASDPSYGHSMAALAAGVDTNPPLLHLLLRVVGGTFGHDPLVYRLTMTAGMALAVVGLYATLRMRLRPGPATVGCAFFVSLPIVMVHATEARFYGWLLAAAIWTAYGVARRRNAGGVGSATLVAVASAGLCGLHYFGLVALAGIVAADVLGDGLGLRRDAWTRRVGRLFPTLPGPAMTACVWPLLRTQRETVASVGGTWLMDDFAANLQSTIAGLFPTATILLLLAMAVVGIKQGLPALRGRLWETLRSPFVGFLLYAAVLFAFDRLVQPVLVARYFILLLPALAVVVAGIAATYGPRMRTVAMASIAVLFAANLLEVRGRLASPSPGSAMGILAAARSPEPVVSDWLAYALPVWVDPTLRDRIVYLPENPRVPDRTLTRAIAYERRMAGIVVNFYGLPVSTVARVDKLESFRLLSPFPETLEDRFAGRETRQQTPIAFDLRRRGTAARAE